MSLILTNIPRIMRKKNWLNGAKLLETWFSRPPAIQPAYGPADTTTIRMDWALTFSRAREVYEQLLKERIWTNDRARVQVADMLRRNRLLMPGTRSFGDLSLPPQSLEPDYVNFRTVGTPVVSTLFFGLDDMVAALGNFTFHVVVSGTVTGDKAGTAFQVTITEVGVYIRDSFDFDGDQFLGFWNDEDDSVILIPPPRSEFDTTPDPYVPVHNRDFREWRAKNGKGGDFLIFSDMKRVKLSPPDTLQVK